MRDILLLPQNEWRHNLEAESLIWPWLLCCWLVLLQYCSMSLSLWDRLLAHNIRRYPPLVAMRWLRGRSIAWAIQVIGVTCVVLCSHILGGIIGGESAEVGLGWGTGTCGALPLHIL